MNLAKPKSIIGKSVFIVAEICSNHGQNFAKAVKLIKKAKESGADAVKFQVYTPETMTIDVNTRYFQVKHPRWGGQTLYQLYKKAYTPWSWFRKLKKVADDLGIVFFATSFDKKAVDLLEEIDVPVHKVSSFELVDLPLIEYIAKTKKTLILSTGMASLVEIKEAVRVAKTAGAKEIILLKCVTSYPANPEAMNLRTIPHLEKLFKCPVGLSDHTIGGEVPIAAVALGARMVEKHFTLLRKKETIDGFFSIEPKELKCLVKQIRIAEKALGKVNYGLTKEERNTKSFMRRRSLFVVKDIKKGDVLNEDNVRSIRPAYGLHPRYLKKIIGKRAKENIKKGTPLNLSAVI